MRKSIALLLVVVFLFCACSAEKSGASSEPILSEPILSEPIPPEPVLLEATIAEDGSIRFGETQLAFSKPQQPYTLLGAVQSDVGFAALYEEAMPEEFNRRFSATETFYALMVQTFDQTGAWVETTDLERHNIIRFSGPAERMVAKDGLLTFCVDQVSQGPADVRKETVDFTVRLDARGDAFFAEDPNHYLHTQQIYWDLLTEDGARLQYTVLETRPLAGYQNTEQALAFRLVLPDGVCADLQLPVRESGVDSGFYDALYSFASGQEPTVPKGSFGSERNGLPTKVLTATLDAAKKTAVVSNSKLTFTLDFAAGTWDCARQYTAALLAPEPIAVSPDGNCKLFLADGTAGYEGPGGGDYVTVDKAGEIHYLYSGSDMDQLQFVSDRLIWASSFSEMRLFDAATGKAAETQLAFDFGTVEYTVNDPPDHYQYPKYLVLQTAYDAKNEKYLIAYRLNSFGNMELTVDGKKRSELPITLAVFDRNGKLEREIDTGVSLPPFAKFALWIPALRLDDSGKVTLYDGINGEYGSYPYL